MSYMRRTRQIKPHLPSRAECHRNGPRSGIFNPEAGLLCCCLMFSMVASADTSVWEIRDGESRIFLGGTVHLLRPGDYPLPDEFEQAYQQTDELYFETDIASMNDLSVQAQMLQQLTYADERSLESVLNQEAYKALAEYTESVGMPIMLMQKFKPGMVVSTLQVLEFQRLGFTPQGVDAHFSARARGDGKPVGALETVQEQIGFLAAMGEGYESEFILLSLEDLADTGVMMEAMITAWREGDADGLTSMFVADMRDRAPALYDSLLKQRNLDWLPQLREMLSDSDTEFVLVGAAHLVGDDGLLAMLDALGYQVQQL